MELKSQEWQCNCETVTERDSALEYARSVGVETSILPDEQNKPRLSLFWGETTQSILGLFYPVRHIPYKDITVIEFKLMCDMYKEKQVVSNK